MKDLVPNSYVSSFSWPTEYTEDGDEEEKAESFSKVLEKGKET